MVNRKPFERILTDAQREEIANIPLDVSNSQVAKLFGVSKWTVGYCRNPESLERAAIQRKERLRSERFAKNSICRVVKRSYEAEKEAKNKKLKKYENMIHELLGQGMGLKDIEMKIDSNLSELELEKLTIESKIKECHDAQTALYRYITPDVEIIDDSVVSVRPEKIVHMTAKEFKYLMAECGLTVPKLAVVCKKRYGVRSLYAYREGTVPVPKPLADILRGYPKKPVIWQGE
jgi:hypothetical protein